MTSQWWDDDEQLVAALAEALRDARDVPAWFTDSAKAAFAWHDIDAELATLTRDSVATDAVSRGVVFRAELAPLRALTFSATTLAIEIEVNGQALVGQVVPEQRVELELRADDGSVCAVAVDGVGSFIIRPLPSGPFQFFCKTTDGQRILTDFIAL